MIAHTKVRGTVTIAPGPEGMVAIGRDPVESRPGVVVDTVPGPPSRQHSSWSVFFWPLTSTSCDGCSLDDLKGEITILRANLHLVPRFKRAVKDHARELGVHPALYGPSKGPSTKLGVETLLGQKSYRLV